MVVASEHMSIDRPSHPRADDPAEIRITTEIDNAVRSTELGRNMFGEVDRLQRAYFQQALVLEDPQAVHDLTQQLLENLSLATNSHIIDGEEHLATLEKRTPVLAVVNHFSAYKLTLIPYRDLGLDPNGKSRQIEPFPIFYAPVMPVAKALGDKLYDGHMEVDNPQIKRIQEAAGTIIVPDPAKLPRDPETQKPVPTFPIVLERTKEHFAEHPDTLLVSFSEGETSGKRNGGGPYHLAEFKTGAFVSAAAVAAPVLPVCMYFNPNSGFEIGILEPFYPEPDKEREYYQQLAEDTRQKMQAWLDQKSA